MRKMTPMKLTIKGIETAGDPRLSVEHGLVGIVVSNHGGRAEESERGTIDCLPEVVEAAAGRIPVFLGRHCILGTRRLRRISQPGVERVIDILRTDFELVMKPCGVTAIANQPRRRPIPPPM